ncbi:phosphoribosyltransferase [Erythrobacter sp.]|uniref:phosphoribosyltransferase n=1 Tax=Erythrobacter sp. TaxID=1042 RepID=UPI001B23238B|nr:phosphoribosyltransferase [Erythrobacter sp.]MBO6526448.1 phosphoribosyltransferase [Erythrobacter sp.]MBO6529339.1 phosphoribosyltransferase [Erythrobacter sp.]
MPISSFQDRRAAGKELASELAKRMWHDPVILALPRGGVPVGFEIAKKLRAPLDLVMVRKLGAPGNKEFAVGAIVDGETPQVVIDAEVARMTGASDAYIERAKEAALAEIGRRRVIYGAMNPVSVKDRTVIVVDDGIATGSTARAALESIRQARPAKIVLAVPVAPPDTIASLASLCDDVICLAKPRSFQAVGAYYADFGQTSDREVVEYLARAREFSPEQTA